MDSKYHYGHKPPKRHRKLLVGSLIILAVVMVGGWLAAQHFLKPNTQLSSSDGIIRHVDVLQPKTSQISNDYFKAELPEDWQKTVSQRVPAPDYAWHGTGQADSARMLEVYVDDVPTKMAVNKLLPISAAGNHLQTDGNVSDNCVNFTDASDEQKHAGEALAKWSGVSFYCDIANTLRNVVGTGSADIINGVVIGQHQYFFVYTDHSAEPDYAPLTNFLSSFRAL